ncbi:hypothetical protein PVK06_004685 [Gossypium arboreum]|uniref:Uncharacterized protein n=1 Tax=Gossypium arboreum TaxID=29729 RepID=A0ABR0QTM5_GOSAR|nr:hypothetical protein PVK06_004685 [Gossypium arboreum]
MGNIGCRLIFFAMSKEEKEVFYMVLKDIKVPDMYASNISRCVLSGKDVNDEVKWLSQEEICFRGLGYFVKKTLGKKWRDHKINLKKEYFKKNISLEEKLRNVPPGMLRKKDGSPMTSEAEEIMEKLRDKKEEYEGITSSDSSVNLEDIDNGIITEVLGPERYGRVRFQGSGVNPTQYFGSSSQQYMPSGS